MRVKDIVGAPKTNVSFGGWQTGSMPKSLFPLGKSGKHYLNFRGGYQWGCVTFAALDCEFRMVLAVDFAKQQFYAYLGMDCEKDTRMLASYEFHGSHPGWHVHAGCGDVYSIPIGRYMGSWRRRIPADHKACRRIDWIVTQSNALELACNAFGIPPSPPEADAEEQMPLL